MVELAKLRVHDLITMSNVAPATPTRIAATAALSTAIWLFICVAVGAPAISNPEPLEGRIYVYAGETMLSGAAPPAQLALREDLRTRLFGEFTRMPVIDAQRGALRRCHGRGGAGQDDRVER